MKALKNNIIFRPFESDGISEGGIIVAESFREKSNRGIIVSVGSGTPKSPMRLRKGQIGHRVKDWGESIEFDGELCYLMGQEAIIAVE